MCSDRLAENEAPACVQSCPNEAIRIAVVDTDQVIEDCEANIFLPGAPDPDYTLPTTNYRTAKALPRNLLPGDYYGSVPNHPHLPLVAMLVLTQLSVGVFLIEWLGANLFGLQLSAMSQPTHVAAGLGLGLLALGASVLHLGRPLYAFRAIVGLRTSWLSREILAFGLFAGLASAYAAARWLAPDQPWLDHLVAAVAVVGLLGVFCSVMIYHDTRRAFWQFNHTAAKFTLTMLGLGVVTVLLAFMADAAMAERGELTDGMKAWGRHLCISLAICTVLKLVVEFSILRHLRDRKHSPQRRSASLLVGPLAMFTLTRIAMGLLGCIVAPLLLAADASNDVSHGAVGLAGPAIAMIFLLTLSGEFLERYLFFAAVVAPKMPGGSAS